MVEKIIHFYFLDNPPGKRDLDNKFGLDFFMEDLASRGWVKKREDDLYATLKPFIMDKKEGNVQDRHYVKWIAISS